MTEDTSTLAPMPCFAKLSALTPDALEAVKRAEEFVLSAPQMPIETHHVIHGGMYARTVQMQKDTVITGAVMSVPTLLILNGPADVFFGDSWYSLEGYSVLPGSRGRKQVIIARARLNMTMIFPTQARTVAEAEREFTAEHEKLMSRHSGSDSVVMTGE